MNATQTRLARQLLGLNQTDFATLLGWTSKRNVVNLERGDKEVMTQTALAIECLLRRNEKFKEFEMINKTQPVFEFIVEKIKKANDDRVDQTTISDDKDNQVLVDIFHDALNEFSELDLIIEDDEDKLIEVFGYDNYCAIREAERGSY